MTKHLSTVWLGALWLLLAGSASAECFPSGLVTYPLANSGTWQDLPREDCSDGIATGELDYQVQPFWVDTPGRYHFEIGEEGAYILLYGDAFDPLTPLNNCIRGDISNLIIWNSYAYFGADLEAHRQYYLVATNLQNFAPFGSPSLWGPGRIQLGDFPGLGSELTLASSVDQPMPTHLGGQVTFSHQASNSGSAPHGGVTVTSPLHPALTYVSDTCGGGLNGNTWSWPVGALAADETQSCDVVTSYLQCRNLEQTARVGGDEPEQLLDNNTSTAVTPPAATPLGDGGFELGTPNPFWGNAPIIVGGARTGDHQLRLNSPDATAIQTLTIPSSSDAYLTFYLQNHPVIDSGAGFSVYMDGTPLRSYFPNNVFESRYFEVCWQQQAIDISAYADGQPHTLEFRQESGFDSGDFTIDDVLIEVCPEQGGDLELTLTSANPSPGIRQTTSLSLTAEHLGGGQQDDVTVTSTLDDNLTYVSDTCGGTLQGQTWTWSLGTLNDGDLQTCEVDVTYERCREIETSAQIAGSIFDTPHNNSPSMTIGAGAEVLLDGGFELGNPHPHWVSTHNNAFFTILCGQGGSTGCSALPGFWGPRSGTLWAWLRGYESDPTTLLEQTVTVPNRGRGFLEFWLNIRDSDGMEDFLQVDIDGTVLFTQGEGALPYTDDYARVLLDVTPWTDDQSHTLGLTVPTTGDAGFHVDDVSLTVCETGPVTCPGSTDPSDDDNDNVPNACDQCPGGDDFFDSDLDLVPDTCDACAGYDDAIDIDADSIPDGCDSCIDVDEDGLCAPFDCNDDDATNGCQIFVDGFESGDVSAWSSSS